jgi:hypothetical protein
LFIVDEGPSLPALRPIYIGDDSNELPNTFGLRDPCSIGGNAIKELLIAPVIE